MAMTTVAQGVVLAYLRVSTNEQEASGAGLAAQRRAIIAEAEHRGWDVADIRWIKDVASAKDRKREGLQAALAALKAGEASVLLVAKMDRLSRSVHDFTAIMAEATRQGWALVALDCPGDITTPTGEAMASILTVFSQLERRLIGQRTKDALDALKAEGVQLGRPRSKAVSAKLRRQIAARHAAGESFAAIARALNDEGIPTPQGGEKWHPTTVRRIALGVR